ncbi:hypothetical protein QQF64_000074, partial [Cirrhinus molitorella]
MEILSKSVTLTAANNFQILTDIKIPDDQNLFSNEPLEKQYVYLQAQFPSVTLEKVVMLSFQSGYMFVQTDKSIYTPASKVNYRIFSLTPNLTPQNESEIMVEIMNPQGITVSSQTSFPVKGMRSGWYTIPEFTSSGIWKVVTRFKNTPQTTFTADFEVKEYVLPTFEVKLKLSRSFFYVCGQSLTVDIEAKYLFGQKVDGNAFVVFGVMDGEKKTSIPTSLQRVQIVKGEGTAALTNDMITKTFPNINQLVGQSIYVSVSVLTESGSEMMEAERRGIQIVTSPYIIHFKRTPQFFKPGMTFDVSVYVTNPEQTPVDNVEVEVNPGLVKSRTRANGIAKFTVNTPGGSSTLEITAKTKDPYLSDEQQAVKKMTAQAYKPKDGSNNYLHILTDAAELQIGDQMKVFLNTGQSPGFRDQDYTYMILSKGQIVQADRFQRRGQSLVSISITVTKDMVPSFRFVAYYHVGSSEVVSDSVWVDVKDTCMGTLKLVVKDKMNVYNTGDKVSLQITGDPGAKVGLVVVDKAVNILNKNKLTQTQIWDIIEKHDIGCTAGGGRDSMGVFTDAGLMFQTSTAGGTNIRTTPECPFLSKRRRRSLDDEDTYYTDSEEIVSRTQFSESWLWEDIELCGNCPSPVVDKIIFLRDSITTWQILAVSLSPTLGICVAEPEEMVVFKSFLIDLKMPYSAVRGEQLEIKAIIHNYTNKKLKVRVEFMETEDVCSLASKKGKYTTIVSIDSDSSIVVSYLIIPMVLGKHNIEVKASDYDSDHSDGVRKMLKVVSEGVLIPLNRENVELNPIKNGEKPLVFKAEIPADGVLDTPASMHISITAEISQTVEQAISGVFMGRLIVRSGGDGESNMILMTLPLIATHYLDGTNQWEAVGMERRNEAINHIYKGYQQQLRYRKSDGSYGTWIQRPSSTWLTAYVVKVFAMASNLVGIDDDVICSALKWLLLNKQLHDGSFKEDTATVIHREMMGDVQGKDADASLTAFVLIAMQESREICARSVGSLNESMRKAVSFLEGRLSKLTNPYAVAMTSYAMANADKLNIDILMRHSTQGEAGRSWTVSGQQYHSLEATAYAVLALVKAKEFDKAGEAVRWLNRQQSQYGGYGTTQATVMVFQAVAEYRTQVKEQQNFNLEVELSVAGRSRPVRWTFKRDNMHLTRSDRVDINKDFTVTARGNGTATLSVLTLYYARPAEKSSDCTFFDLTVKMDLDPKSHTLVKQEEAIETYQLTMNFFYKSDKTDATMTILDIGIPTGFTVDGKDLETLSTGKGRYSHKFEMDKVILYLDKVSRRQKEVISFRIHKLFNVGLLQPAAVTIYEYYSPDARCTKFYHPERTGGALNTLCKGDLCYCAEENCSYQKKNRVSDQERFNRSCEAGVDYVYKVTVVGMDLQHTVDIYNMKVEQVLKEGTDKEIEGNVRPFLARPACREHLGLVKGKSYLVIGKSVDLPKLGGSVQYILGERTWIEYWPTLVESQTPEHRERNISISEFQNAKLIYSCCSKQEKRNVSKYKRLEKACEDDKGYGTDNAVEGLLKMFKAHPRCREYLALEEYKSYLIMGPSTDLQFHADRLQYILGEQTWVEYWPTQEESQTPEHRERYIGISEFQGAKSIYSCCSKQEESDVSRYKRLEKACKDPKGYAYKVTVVGTVLDKTTDIYNLKIEQVLRNGTDNAVDGLLKIFKAHPRCRESLALEEYKSYLIMGPSTDLQIHANRLQYILGEHTWVEYWPTKEEGQTPEHMERYIDIRSARKQSARVFSLDSEGRGGGYKSELAQVHKHSQEETQTDRMDVKLLFLTVLLSSPLLTQCDPLFVLSAPNLMRVGSSENVFVEAQDYSGEDLNVVIIVKNYPKKDIDMVSKSVKLTAAEQFQKLTAIEIPTARLSFSDDPLEKQYVFLQARFPSVILEKVVMVSFQAGYIFVQTDKPIYTPASIVKYRIFSLTPNMQQRSEVGITVEIRNPQDITVSSVEMFLVKGMQSLHFPIPEVTSLGIWKVVTRFTKNPQVFFTAEFEVKEYVLPTFEVKLTPSKSFFYVSDESLTVNIEAKYMFGQKLDGYAYVVFGVMDGQKKTSITSSLQKVQVSKGTGSAELTKEMIHKTFSDFNQKVGQSIYVSVSLLTESGSEMVEAERRGIQIVTSPYTIHFKKTPQFFKPGMPLSVTVYVTNPDQTPAENLHVELNTGESSLTSANGIAKFSINTQEGTSTLEITAKTNDPQLNDAEQAVEKLTAQAYKPKGDSKNYMDIGINAAELQIGQQVKVYLSAGKSPGFTNQDFTYMILSKGQIVKVDRFKRSGQSVVALFLPITKDMVPSFRIVAYYRVGSSEVVSDSVWIDVKDTCMGKLQLKVKDKPNYYDTVDEVQLQITGDPGAKVGLVAVDKAVSVLNKNRLTQTKIWDSIENHDTGCTAGGGRDSMGVFSDAGLMFESNTAGGTKIRTVPNCPIPAKRKRRAESLLLITRTLVGKYSGELKQCCIDALRNNKLGYTCERRATYIMDGPECVKAFLHCCNEIKSHRNIKLEEELILARNDDVEYTESDKITSRTQFPESWLWEDIELCEKCQTPLTEKTFHLKDSITTWQILGVSLSPTLGICVAEPEEIVVFKHFFIDLKIPYSAVRGEQLEIKAIIHNYTNKKQKKVRVDFMETPDVCSPASKKGKYRTEVSVDKDSSVAVSFVIIPMTLGYHVIEVKASTSDSRSDGVRKTLKVVSEGVQTKLHRTSLELNPAKDGEKPLVLRYDIPDDRLPATPANQFITITGEEISKTVEQAIDGSFMGRLIVQPSGCGEQNMILMTLPVIATHYLDGTNQWEAVGMDRRNEALSNISTGYQGQLKFRKIDGSYGVWERTPSSTWLTAYVAKVFAMANNLIFMDDDMVCSALKWLILSKQLPDGSFKEDNPVRQSEMVGGIRGQDADASLTAFVLIALQEGREICAGSVSSLQESIGKAVSFLEGRLPKLTNPYAVAMTSYAMASAGKLNKDILMRHSTKGE